jgi:hypothetical protein
MAEILAAGSYRARAIEGALSFTNSGKEQVTVRFDLLDFPQQVITWFGYFTDNTTQSTFRALRTAGWKGQDLSDLSDLSYPDCPEVLLVVEHEKYKDKTYAKVRWVNSATGPALKSAMPPDQARTFAARMRDQLAAFDAAAKQAGAAAPKKNGAPSSAKGDEGDPERLEARAQEEASQSDLDIPF